MCAAPPFGNRGWLPLEVILQSVHLPLPEAAERLGVSSYALQSRWEEIGLGPWPYNKRFEQGVEGSSGAAPAQGQDELECARRLSIFRANVQASLSTTTALATLAASQTLTSSQQEQGAVNLTTLAQHLAAEAGREEVGQAPGTSGVRKRVMSFKELQREISCGSRPSGSKSPNLSRDQSENSGRREGKATANAAASPKTSSIHESRDLFDQLVGNAKSVAEVLSDEEAMEAIEVETLEKLKTVLMATNVFFESFAMAKHHSKKEPAKQAAHNSATGGSQGSGHQQ